MDFLLCRILDFIEFPERELDFVLSGSSTVMIALVDPLKFVYKLLRKYPLKPLL